MENGILLRKEENGQLSWADTCRLPFNHVNPSEMAQSDSDFTEWEKR
jgi:hypothetical protein